jgi:hypothetical protein
MPCRRSITPFGVELDYRIGDRGLALLSDWSSGESDHARIGVVEALVSLDSEPCGDVRILSHVEEPRRAAGVLDAGEGLESRHPVKTPVCPSSAQNLDLSSHHLVFVRVWLPLSGILVRRDDAVDVAKVPEERVVNAPVGVFVPAPHQPEVRSLLDELRDAIEEFPNGTDYHFVLSEVSCRRGHVRRVIGSCFLLGLYVVLCRRQ